MKRGRSRIDDSVYPLFVTTAITEFIPVFRDSDLAKRALRLLEERRRREKMRVFAYVLMANHLHAIVQASRKGGTSHFMASWKSLTARLIIESVSPAAREAFAKAARAYGEPERKAHKVWMSRFDDVALFDQSIFATKLEYIHCNPVKAGLVERAEDYPFSSAGFYYAGCRDSIVELTDCRPLLAGRKC